MSMQEIEERPAAEASLPGTGPKPLPVLAAAASVAILTILFEYVFRHYVMFWFPSFGDLRVNDLVSMLIGYVLLIGGIVLIRRLSFGRMLLQVPQGLKYLSMSKNGYLWILLMVIAFEGFGIIDRLFLAKYTLPSLSSTYRDPSVWFAGAASVLYAVSLLLINGVLVPVAEEFLWRGQVQQHLSRLMHPAVAIGITSVLFSLKHVLVDASFGRFLAIIAFGIVCGILARKKGWETSAALHVFINTVFSIAGLIIG